MKSSKHKYDYGKCHVCGERMEERQIKQDFWIRGKLIIIEGVPSGVCPQCGEKVVRADVGRIRGHNESDAPMSNKDTAQILADHYQKTYELTYELWSQRNRIFLILLVVIGVGTVLTFDVSGTRPLLVRWVAITLRIETDDKIQQLQSSFPFQLLQSIFTLIVFYLMVNLYHRAIYVLRNYRYLGSLEREIRQTLEIGKDSPAFTRESSFYWTDRSVLLSTVKYVYIILLGLLLSAFLFKRLYDDFQTGGWLLKIADLLIGGAIILYFFAYATSSISWDQEEKIADLNNENGMAETQR